MTPAPERHPVARVSVAHDGAVAVFEPGDAPVLIGRTADPGVRVAGALVSREHARLVYDGGWVLEDLGSRNGTFVSGRRLTRTVLSGTAHVHLGDPDRGARLTVEVETATSPSMLPAVPRRRHDLFLGRDPDSWIVLEDPMASWRHARVDVGPEGWDISDLSSTNGTLVNDEDIGTAARRLREGDWLLVGNTRLAFRHGALEPVTGGGFVVSGVTLEVGGNRRIVDGVTFAVPRPSLVAVIGPSGAGKSSLMRLITGQVTPTDGTVTLHGASMTSQRRAHRGQIGVVPQYTVAHASLTARQALDHTARLRLASDIGAAERRRLVLSVLDRFGLSPHADTRISRLSGGQLRRVGIAMEMLTDPDMLILDEPTAGLDPSLVLQIMSVLRELADSGKTVVLVTHDLEHLDKVDAVLALRAGGRDAYYGPPGDVLPAFGATTWAETFAALAEPEQTPRARPPAVEPAVDLPEVAVGVRRSLSQAGVVLRRQLRLIAADPLYLLLMVGMPLALGLLALAVPGSGGLGVNRDPTTAQAGQLLVLLVVGGAFLGLSGPIRDLVGERSIYQHERDAGLSPFAYLGAKAVLFGCAATVQSVLLVGLVLLVRQAPPAALVLGRGGVEVAAAIVATALSGVALGLAVSSYVSTTEQTMPPLVLLVMGQLVLSGGLFPLDGRGALSTLSWLSPTRWGYAAAASTVELNASSSPGQQDALWTATASNWWGCMLLLSVMIAVFLVVAARGVLRRASLA